MIKLILIFLLLSLNLFSQYPIKVEVEKEDKYIMGVDSIYVKIKLKNISGKEFELKGAPGLSHWYLGGKECIELDLIETILPLPGDIPIDKSGGAHKKIPKDWEKEEIHNILWTNIGAKCKLEKEGIYNFYYVYRDDLADKDLTERVKVEINYVMPEGEDREAYEYFKGYPLARPMELLDKFPTSTYAGWALARTANGVDFIYHNGKDLIDDMLRPAKERIGRNGSFGKDKNGKEIWVTPEEEAERYIGYAEKYISENSNSYLSAFIYYSLSLSYLVLHLWEKAYEYMEESLKREWPESLYGGDIETMKKHIRVLREGKDELVKRGFVKGK